MVGPTAHADLTHELQSIEVANATGLIIASDALNADVKYNRDAIEAAVEMQYARAGASGYNYDYRFDFRLINSAGVAQTLNLGGGSTGTVLAVVETVDMTAGFSPIVRVTTGKLRPAGQLDAADQYKVEVSVSRKSNPVGFYVSLNLSAETVLASYWHFPQLISGDAALNVITRLESANWTRIHRLRTDPMGDYFRVQALVRSYRYDDFGAADPVQASITTRLTVILRDDLGTVIPLEQSTFEFDHTQSSFIAETFSMPKHPTVSLNFRNLNIKPVSGLLSRTRTYNLQVTAGHFETPGAAFPKAANTMTSATQRLLDFNGTLAFAGTTATFSSIASPFPAVGAVVSDYVETSLRINNQSGQFQGLTFGNGTELQVRLRNNGVATLESGTLNMTGVGHPVDPGGINYILLSVIGSASSINGTVRMQLPSGLGVATDPENRIHDGHIFFLNVALNGQLKPTATTLTSPALRWAAEESKPFVFESTALSWDVSEDRLRFTPTGVARFVRSKAYSDLLADTDVPVGNRFKLSNDGYYWNLNAVISPEVVIDVDPVNGSALLSCDLSMAGSLYRSHFPYNALMTSSSGTQRVSKDLVVPSFGGLLGVGTLKIPYMRNCPEGDCDGVVAPDVMDFVPDGGKLAFTRDGGLAGSGVMAAPFNLAWGWVAAVGDYTHEVMTFEEAGFLASGLYIAGSQFGGDPRDQAARLLLTGVNPNLADQVERPGTNAYTAGLGDYPGMNFRVQDFGAQTAKLVLAGQTTPAFPLTNRCKYVVRQAGVSGIHEAVNGQFSPTAVIYGMDFTFDTLGWAFLDSDAVASRTAGSLSVPYPSNFNLAFEKLMISCLGALEAAEIAPGDVGADKKLAYWNADFVPLSLSFQGKATDFCDPASRFLVVGVKAYAGGIPQPLSGEFGFQTNGNLITQQSNLLGELFDSRLQLPNNFTIVGPAQQTYAATPVGKAYLNDYALLPDGMGWMSIAALLDVPFFSDLEIHLHTTAAKNDDSPLVYMMGGYPDLGWDLNGKHFFNEVIFDLGNRGFPAGVSLEQYRNGYDAPNAKYRPRAQKKWLGVVNFDYPLQWRPASRSFVSFVDMKTDLLVLSAEHRIDYMAADQLEVTFGASISTYPKISIANFVADKATDVTALLFDYLQTNVVDAGVQGLNDILDVKQREFFELVLTPAVDVSVDAIMTAVTANWSVGSKTWVNSDLASVINGPLLNAESGLFATIEEVLTAAKNVAGVLQEIDLRLGQAESALDAIEGFIQEKDGKTLGDLESAVLGLANLVSSALSKPEFQEKIEELLAKGEPRIIEIRNVIGEVRDYISTVRDALGETGEFTENVTAMVEANAASIQTEIVKVRAELTKILGQVDQGTDSLAALDAHLRAQMKQRIADYIIGLPVIREFNRMIKQRVYDVAARLTECIDEVFDQINLTLRDIIREVAGGLDDKFEEMLGDVASVMATANIEGYAKVRNDSLTELRLDLKAQIDLPDEMKAHVFLLIRELNSDNTASECLPASGKATEVTVGAKDVSVEWLFPGVSLNIAAKFVISGSAGDGFPLLGMGGGIELVGEISFGESVVIHKLGASVMFGAQENYLSAAVQLEVQGFQGGGGIFFGRACSLEPFFWDDTVAAVIGKPPFTGFYGYGELWIPINQLIGIPSTCLFNLSAGVGVGAGMFIEGPTVFGKMFLAVSGDLLCIVSITGEISMVGVARPSGLSLAGEGRFQAEIGYCPICLKFDKTARMVREGGKWSRDVK